MGQFTFNATSENYTVDKMYIEVGSNFTTSTSGVTIKYLNSAGVQQSASTAFVYDATTLLKGVAAFTGLTMFVPKGGSANVDVYVDLTDLASNGASGANSAVYLDATNGFHATGASGVVQANIGTGVATLYGNTFYNRRTKPTFATQPVSGAPSSSNPILKFTVVADAKGNLDIKQMSFNIATSTASVTNVNLYDANGTLITTSGGTPDYNGNIALLISGVNDTVLTIGATPITYMLKGTVSGWTTAASLTTSFRQDAAATSTVAAATAIANASYLVWSDKSASAHTTATADWTNGYLVKSLTTAQSF